MIKYIPKTIAFLLRISAFHLIFVAIQVSNFSLQAQEVFELGSSAKSLKKMREIPKRYEPFKFPTLKILQKYEGEQHQGVLYLSTTQREKYRVHFCEQRLCDRHGQVLNPKHKGPKQALASFPVQQKEIGNDQQGLAIFVMDAQGELWLSFEAKAKYFHHSSLLAGGPVAAAGEMIVFQGKLYGINNQSGHYQPPPLVIKRVLSVLHAKGIDTQDILIKKFGSDF